MPDANIDNPFAFLFDGRNSLLNLALIQDGHPTHTDTDDLGRGDPRPNKTEAIQEQMKTFRKQLEAAVNADTAAKRKAAADAAADAIEGVVFFLATYNFDTARRFAIMHFALTPITKHGKAAPILAELVDQDDKAINDERLKNSTFLMQWKKRANRAWIRLDAWHDRIKKPAAAFLERSLEPGP